MSRAVRWLFAALVSITLVPSPAAADLASFLPDLIGSSIVLDNAEHGARFQASGAEAGESFSTNIVEQLSSFPLASSAGGLTYTLDPTLGTLTRSTDTFGLAFTERAQTIGKGRWNFGFNYLQASYDKIDDLDLRGGHLIFQAGHAHTGEHGSAPPGEAPSPFFEGDVIAVQTSLQVHTKTSVFFANYGLTDRVDVGVAVPVVNIDLDGHAHLTINRLSTASQPTIHRFPGGGSARDISLSDSASGLGDVLVRGKVRFGSNYAAALDVRLPTGDEKDLLGTGFTQTRLTLVGSGSMGAGRPNFHGNLGYQIASGSSDIISDPPDELSYGAGIDFAVHPRATIAVEASGRTLFNASRAVLTHEMHHFRVGSETGPVEETELPLVDFEHDDLQLLFGSAAVRFNPVGNLLLTLGARVQFGNDGLRDEGLTGLLGAEYSF